MSGLSPEQKLEEMGIVLPEVPAPAGSYLPCIRAAGGFVFVSGQLPLRDGKLLFEGRVGDGVSTEQAKKCARLCAVNCIAALRSELGDLAKVRAVVKVTGYVSSADGFFQQADVLNGASDLFADVFGEKGRHSRAAVGVSALPLGAPVEIEVIAQTEPS